MKKLTRFSLAALILGAAIAPSAMGIPAMFSDRSLWETAVGTWTDVDEAQIPTGYGAFPGVLTLQTGTTITFDTALYGAQVPTDWATWSGGNTPRVLVAGVGSVTATANMTISSFGLEMEPISSGIFSMTLANGDTLTQDVDGTGGAKFFGWADMPVVSFTMSTTDFGFAFGRMVTGPGAPPPSVPDGGSLTLATGLLWAGLIVIRRKYGHRAEDHSAAA